MEHEYFKPIMDSISIGACVSTILGLLPHIAALFTVIWTAIRIYETETVQKLMHKKKKGTTN
jgi:chromate transport protein ChrA